MRHEHESSDTEISYKGDMDMKRFFFALTIAICLSMSGSARATQLYFGDLHSHTSFSDGKGVPAEAYDMARNQAGLDFWTVTDHYEQIDVVKGLAPDAPKQKEWDVMNSTAVAKSEDGKFIGLAGFEWFDQTEGHMNVINSKDVPKLAQTVNLKQFYKWLAKHPDVLTGFNHPSDEDDHRKVFDKLAYIPEIASQTFYIAVNKDEDFKYYYMALDNGWRVAPSGQQDNHEKNWGLHPNGCYTGVYADALTKSSLFDAFRARRFYATNNRRMAVDFQANGSAMGSRIAADKADFKISASIAGDSATIAKIQLVTNGSKVVKEWTPAAAKAAPEFSLPVDWQGSKWFVAVSRDGNGKYSVSAPIWVSKK